METLSAFLAICAGNSPIPGKFPAQRPVARSFDVFFDLINGRVNNGEADDLRRYRAHCDVIVMKFWDLVGLISAVLRYALPPSPGTPQQIPQAFGHWANIMTGLLLHSPRRALSSQSSRPLKHSAT